MYSKDSKSTKLTLTIDNCTVTWEKEANDCDFGEILNGFLACMWGQTFVPGTEIHVFKDYIEDNEELYHNPEPKQYNVNSTWD